MTSFAVRKIQSLSQLGETLQRKRLEMGLSLAQISRRTLVAERYLKALESESWNELPGEVYVINFLRRYADEIGLQSDRVVKQYQGLTQGNETSSISSLQATLPLPSKYFLVLPKLIRNVMVGVVSVVLIAYLGIQAMHIITPPNLVVFSPTDNYVTDSGQIIIDGETDPEVTVLVNSVAVPVNKGYFTETVDLQKGLNIIKITATKKYSKSQVVYRKIMWQEDTISKY
jgi:cytoskeletal protein RodZ